MNLFSNNYSLFLTSGLSVTLTQWQRSRLFCHQTHLLHSMLEVKSYVLDFLIHAIDGSSCIVKFDETSVDYFAPTDMRNCLLIFPN